MPVRTLPSNKKFQTLKAKVDKKIAELNEKVPAIIGRKLKPIEVKYDLHTVAIGGTAMTNIVTGEQVIRLHPTALMEYGVKYINDTVVHEFAHIVTAHYNWGAKPHGKEWKAIMRTLGAEPATRHSMDLEKCLEKHGKVFNVTVPQIRKQKTVEYECGCGEKHLLGMRVHNKIRLGSVYICKLCKTNLKEKK